MKFNFESRKTGHALKPSQPTPPDTNTEFPKPLYPLVRAALEYSNRLTVHMDRSPSLQCPSVIRNCSSIAHAGHPFHHPFGALPPVAPSARYRASSEIKMMLRKGLVRLSPQVCALNDTFPQNPPSFGVDPCDLALRAPHLRSPARRDPSVEPSIGFKSPIRHLPLAQNLKSKIVIQNGAQKGTRTLTPCGTRPSSVRVYQFHHLSIPKRGKAD